MTQRDGVGEVIERLNAGAPFVGLSVDERDHRAAALEAVLATIVADGTRIVWVGNPLRSPLTVERFLIQIVGAEVDLRVERGPQELATIIAKPVGSESRLLIVVQQPESIDAPMRERLAAMAPYLHDGPVRTQFLFAGSTAFVLPALPPLDLTPFVQEVPAPARRWVTAPLLLVLLTLAAGLWLSLAPASRDEPSPAPSAASASPAQAPPSPPPPPPVIAEAPDPTALLRREFDAFLAGRAASLPPLSDSQKDALFLEFLAHRGHD